MATKPASVQKTSFNDAISAIQAARALTMRDLTALSDMTAAQFAVYQPVWLAASEDRRSEVLQRLRAIDAQAEGFKYDFAAAFRLALADADERVRIAAVAGLESDDSTDLLHIFVRMLGEDSSQIVKAATATALGTYLHIGELEELEPHERDKVYSALMGALLVAPRNSLLVHRLIESIGYADNEETRAIIAGAHADGSEDLRLSAMTAMARSGNQIWQDRLIADLRSDSSQLRERAAWACGELYSDEATSELGRLIDDDDEAVRFAAIVALGELASDDSRALLKRATDSKDEEIATAAEEALENAEMLGNVRLMLDSMDDEDPGD